MLRRIVRIGLYLLAGFGSLIVLIIVLALIFGDDGSKPEGKVPSFGDSSNTEIPTPTPTPVPVIVVDLRELLDGYAANKVAAENKWKNKIVETEGIAYEFNSQYFDIVPTDSDMFQMSGARCYPPSDATKKMDNLVKEDRVVIRGNHTGILGSLIRHIRVTDCVFEKQ